MDVKGAKALKERLTITSFRGRYDFLSNFYPSPIIVDGIDYPTVEHAFQAYKTHARSEKKAIAAQPTPGQAKRAGGRVTLRPDWEEIKLDVMLELLRKKFSPGRPLAAKLLDTGDRALIEGNTWDDRYWGAVWVNERQGWSGKNKLGKLLMQVREELQSGR